MFKESLTDPKDHKPGDFIYLVHGLIDWDHNGQTRQEMTEKVRRLRDPTQFYSASMIGHLSRESAVQRIGWQGGEVNQIGTFGAIGVIFEPTRDDLVQIAWNCDIGSPHDPEKFREWVQAHKGRFRYPLKLLTDTKGPESIKYNEIILSGDPGTSIKGVYFKPVDSQSEIRARLLSEIAGNIMQGQVPIIELPIPVFKDYNDLDPKERELRKELDHLREHSELMQAHYEFNNPSPASVSFGYEYPELLIDPTDYIKRIS